jgi:hypothetical protein
MQREILKQLVAWLCRHKPGTAVRLRDWVLEMVGVMGVVPLHATLGIRVFRKDGMVEDRGVVSVHAVTDAFVAALVDTLQSSEAAFSLYKYHDSGEGSTAEAAADTVLETPCGEARDTGTQIEGATANIYKSVATHTYAGSFAITEHGLFNDSGAGTLMDRSVFTAVNVASGDKIEYTYQLTCASGG